MLTNTLTLYNMDLTADWIEAPYFSTDSITACDSLTWTDGINYTESNNTAIDTSACVTINTVSLKENSLSGIQIRPKIN